MSTVRMEEPADTLDEPVHSDPAAVDAPLGVGGGGQTVPLDSDEQYTYLYRVNDTTDPDKADSPLTLEVVDGETDELLWQVDLIGVEQIEAHYLTGDDGLVLVGSTETGVTSLAYTFPEDDGEAVEVAALSQSGAYRDSALHDGVLYTVTYAEGEPEPEGEIVDLPDSVSEDHCIVGAVDVYGGEFQQIAYSGAGDDISLYRRHIYIPYPAETEEGEPEMNMAQILLDGIDMELVIVE